MKLTSLTPMLRTWDMEGTIAFYTETLGFSCDCYSAEWNWASLTKDHVKLMLSGPNEHEGDREPVFTGSLYFILDDVDHIWERVQDRVQVSYALETFPHGMREFGIYDNNGYLCILARPSGIDLRLHREHQHARRGFSKSGTPGMDAQTGSKRNTSLICVMCFLTVMFLLWPCYRSFLNVDIDINEGWNAYFADAAWGRMPLYPATDQLITNNYPPLSFYVVGGVGRLLGDNILAGRLISLVAILIMAIILYLLLRHWKTSQTAAFVSCVYFVAIMCRFFTGYAGMNDPQLLAQCVMAAGLLLFLRAMETGNSLLIPVVIMVVAGFIKHNIIAMPVTAFIWLVWQQPRRLPMALVTGAVTAGAGLVLCHWWYGPEFFTNLLAARIHDWRHAVGAIGHLQWVAVGLAVWLYIGITCWSLKSIQFCNLFVIISLVTFFMQKMGDGVAHNAMFDLVMATSMALGLAYEYSPLTPLARWYSPVLLRNVLIVAICARLMISTRLEPFRLFVDPSFRTELAIKEAEMEKAIERIQNTPGDVAGSTYACYRAGKPFIIDPFGISQRIRSGTVPANVVSERVREKRLTIIMVKQLHD